MSVKISSLNTASTIDSGDDINIAGNNPLTFSDWGGGWLMQDGTYIRSLNQKSIWLGDGVLASQGGLSVGYGGTLPTAGYGIIAGRLGIGLNSPTARLDLTTDGNGTTATYSGIHVRQNSTSVSEDVAARITFNGDGNTTIYGFIEQRRNSYDSFALGTKNSTGSGAGYVSLYTQGNERVRIAGGGNVLIGTTADAGFKLDVNGSARFNNYIRISDGGNPWDIGAIFNYTNSDLFFNMNGSEKMRMNAYGQLCIGYSGANATGTNSLITAGNVGIGTPSPQKVLDVVTGANTFVTVGAATSMGVGQWAGIHFGYRENNTNYRKSAIVFERTDNAGGGANAAGKVYILNGPGSGAGSATLADAKLTIDEYGKIGIGTTTPGYTLDVNGSVRSQGIINIQNGYYENKTLVIGAGDTKYLYVDIQNSYGNVEVLVSGYASGGSASCLVSWIDGGHGGGTSYHRVIQLARQTQGNPVLGNLIKTAAGGSVSIQNTGGSPIELHITIKSYGQNSYAANAYLSSTAPSGNNQSILNIDDINSRVGIGTTSPSTKLYVEGGSANWSLPTPGAAVGTIHLDPGVDTENFGNAITFGASDSDGGTTAMAGIYVRSDGAYGTKMYFGTTDSYAAGSKVAVTIDESQRVGIGTTSPARKLDVNGSVAWGSSSGEYMYAGGTSHLFAYSISTLNVIYSGGTNGLQVNNAADNAVLIKVTDAGSVGIGIATPDYKLAVNGDIYNTNLTFPMTGYSTANSPRIINPMSIKLYDNYFNGIAGSDYGTVLDINGRSGHVDSQIYMDASQTLYFRIASYASAWGSWKTILDNTNFSTYINLAAYLPLAGGTMTGNITYNPGEATNWYIRGAANGATIRLKYSGGSTNRSGALGWVDNANNYSDVLTWVDDNLNATVPITSNSTISTSSNIISTGGYVQGGGIILQNNYIEATVASGGFWNSNHDVRFYPSAGNIWNITGNTFGLTSFALRFLDKYGTSGTVKAQIFWSTSELGLKNDTDWVIKANQGGSYGGTLYGAWAITGKVNAKAGSYINGASNSDWGFSVENTGTTNANGLYVNIGASSTGIPFRVDKGGAALFDITNAGNATIKGNLTISGATISLNSSAADIFQKYNNGSKIVGWNLTTDNLFRLFDYTNELIIFGFNATSQNLDIYSNTVTINRFTTSTATLIFNASTAGNIWKIEKSDANGLSIQKGGVQQFGINAAGQASFIGSLAVVGDYISVGSKGLYSDTYTAFFRRNDVSTYGAWDITGVKNGYTGLFYNAPNRPHTMFNTTDGSGGLYYETLSRWILYYNYTHNCLGIGGATTSSAYRLYVTGNSYISGSLNVTSLNLNGLVYSTSAGFLQNANPSDLRLKEEINPLEYGLKEVMGLNPVTYKWKDGSNGNQRSTGLIAQEVQKVMPEYVKTMSDGSDLLGLDSYAINIVLINAIKELQAKIEILENK